MGAMRDLSRRERWSIEAVLGWCVAILLALLAIFVSITLYPQTAGPFSFRLVRIVEMSHADQKAEYWIARDWLPTVYVVAIPPGMAIVAGQTLCVKALKRGTKTEMYGPILKDLRSPALPEQASKCDDSAEPPDLARFR